MVHTTSSAPVPALVHADVDGEIPAGVLGGVHPGYRGSDEGEGIPEEAEAHEGLL